MLAATLYFTAGQGSYVVFRYRQIEVTVQPDGQAWQWPTNDISVTATKEERFPRSRSPEIKVHTIHNGVDQLIVEGHGYAWLYARGIVPTVAGNPQVLPMVDRVQARIQLLGVDLVGPVSAEIQLDRGTAELAKRRSALAYWHSRLGETD